MIVELHLLQNFSPSCLNRDDTNTPKDCEFGGHRRARISSQCIKRTARNYFRDADLLPPANRSVRTRQLVDKELVPALMALGKPPDDAVRAATAALAAGGLKIEEHLTQYLLFLGRGEIDELIRLIAEHFDALTQAGAPREQPAEQTPPESAGKVAKKPAKKSAKQEKAAAKAAVPDEVVKAVRKLLDGGKAADLGLFGRMLADMPERNVDAACQVAHAISTNRVAMETDYFTAVDDLQQASDESGAGAGMIGDVEFNSSCFYRYANIDTGQLSTNLGADAELARTAVDAFLRASVEALPTGKQNTFAAHNPPALVFAVVRPSGQWNLANAFVRPINGEVDGLVANSVKALDDYWRQLTKMYGMPAGLVAAVATTEDGQLKSLAGFQKDGVAEIYETVRTALSEEKS